MIIVASNPTQKSVSHYIRNEFVIRTTSRVFEYSANVDFDVPRTDLNDLSFHSVNNSLSRHRTLSTDVEATG